MCYITWSTNGHDVRKIKEKNSWKEQLQYIGEGIIQRKITKEEEFEKFFTPLESPGKSPSSNCNGNTMLDLKEHFVSNFNMWSLGENRIRKEKNGKEKWDVEILVLSD